jgi:alpha-ketoglutarate-dependent taurine dioxygenase
MSQTAIKIQTSDSGPAVRKIGTCLGSEIDGLDLSRPLDEASAKFVADALVEHEMIIFRDQDITSEQLMAFGGLFGDLTVHPFSTNDATTSTLIRFENTEDNPPALTDIWHSDETFREDPPMGTVLCAKQIPEIGGDTLFASMTAAYDGLSDRMKQFISSLEAIHDFKPFKTLFADTPEDRRNRQHFETLYPPATHPVVRVHPVSGKKILFVNPQFTVGIKDMDERESRSLLDTLFYQATIPEYQFRHHWQPNTIAFWDNRSTQHYAVHDYYPQRRIMERVTIKGDRPVGLESADPATVRRPKFGETGDAKSSAKSSGAAPLRQFRRDLPGKGE